MMFLKNNNFKVMTEFKKLSHIYGQNWLKVQNLMELANLRLKPYQNLYKVELDLDT